MKKSNLIITFIVVLIVLAVGYYVLFLKSASVPTEQMGDVPCSSEYWEAINKSDVTICESVTEISSVKDPYYDNACREWCIQEVAYEKGDPQLCQLINNFKDITPVEGWDNPRESGSHKDHCYMSLAKKLEDVSLCENVETGWAKTNCPL